MNRNARDRSTHPTRLTNPPMFAIKRHVRTHQLRKPLAAINLRLSPELFAKCSASRWQRPFHGTSYVAGKRVSKKLMKELIQGPIAGAPLPPSDKDDLRKESLQDVVRNNMRKFPDCVLLTKVGNFYEVCRAMF